jgi:hypothetical protein
MLHDAVEPADFFRDVRGLGGAPQRTLKSITPSGMTGGSGVVRQAIAAFMEEREDCMCQGRALVESR